MPPKRKCTDDSNEGNKKPRTRQDTRREEEEEKNKQPDKPKKDEEDDSSDDSSSMSDDGETSSEDDLMFDDENLFMDSVDSEEDEDEDEDEDEGEGPPDINSLFNGKGNIFIIPFFGQPPPASGGDDDDPFSSGPPSGNSLFGGFKKPGPVINKNKRPHPKPINRTKVEITEVIRTIDDLITIADKYEDKPNLEYPFNMTSVKKLKGPLKEFNQLVGLDDIKKQVLDQILYLLSDLRDDDQMLHTVIYGSPGSGKTALGLLLSKVYAALGYSNGTMKIVKRSDLVAGYVGHTAPKTQKAIDEARGGVLFIDEAYSLGNKEGRDSFSKEAIDTLNANLTELKTEFICIIAGYQKELDECFFATNPGLNRRFPFRYHIKEYGHNELAAIFTSKIRLSGWTCEEIPLDFFQQNVQYFKFKGGDMEVLSQMSKIAYSRRTFGKHQEPKKHLLYDDVKEGMLLFLNSDEVKSRGGQDLPESVRRMYL